jgi:hypothetical protein
MHTIEIPDAKIKRYIPSDLSSVMQQYIMCELIFHFQNDTINYDEFSLMLFTNWEWNLKAW